MRWLIVIGFVLLFMSKFFYACFLQIHFYVNQGEITRLECVNKDKPNLHCNGKCYLAKKLKMAEEHLQSKKERQSHSLHKMKSLEDADWYFVERQTSSAQVPFMVSAKPMRLLAAHYFFDPNHFIFRPPCS